MMHVKIIVEKGGKVNTNVTTEEKKARFSCGAYINMGTAYFGMLHAACSATSNTKYRWISLQNESDPAVHRSFAQLHLFAVKGNAEFYVDALSVNKIPAAQ